MADDLLFDVEQMCFQRLQQGKLRLKKELYSTLDTDSIRRWLAVSLYSSEFSVTPSTRTEEKCQVHLFDEAKQIISTVSVDYIVGSLLGGVFNSVPVIITKQGCPLDSAIQACMFLNTSLHQSKVVKACGFVAVIIGTESKCISYQCDGTLIREVLI